MKKKNLQPKQKVKTELSKLSVEELNAVSGGARRDRYIDFPNEDPTMCFWLLTANSKVVTFID